MQLLLLHYNNYFNRIIKKKETIADYKAADTNYKEVSNINFNPGDGVATSLVLGLGQNGSIFDSNEELDYLVAYETVNNEAVINSRWFILEQDRKRAGQYELTLKRDVLADNYNAVINSPIFLEKGFINDVNDPLLYNSEAMKFNQIKQLEIPLMDETKSGWVVGYIPSDAFPKAEPNYDRVEKVVSIPVEADITVNDITKWKYWNYCSNNPNYKFMIDTNGKRRVSVKIRSEQRRAEHDPFTQQTTLKAYLTTADYEFYPNSTESGTYLQKNSNFILITNSVNYPTWYQEYGPVTTTRDLNAKTCSLFFDSVRNNNSFNEHLNTIFSENGLQLGDTATLQSLKDQIIHDSSNDAYYRIKVIYKAETDPIVVNDSTPNGILAATSLNNAMTRDSSITGSYTTFTVANYSASYAIQLEQVGVSLYVDLNSDRAHLNDAPYDMFCIPFSDTLKLQIGNSQVTCSKNIALSMATEIAKDLGSGTVYDVQLLPYCPNRTLVIGSNSPDTLLDLTRVKYDVIKESVTNAPKSAVIWCTESTFQVPISTESTVAEFRPTEDAPSMLKSGNYYTIPNDISSFISYMGLTALSSNNILVYKVNKNTNRVIESNLYGIIGVTTDDYLNIYTTGNEDNPEIHISLHDYSLADYYFVFLLKKPVFGGNNISDFSKKVRITESYSILNPGNDALTRKLANECDVLRLVSQNYSAIFEFSAAKSGGVDGFLADCTYKPWSPYIHILPKLKGLYGDNFVAIDDARGLICGGDMSLPQLSNAWANYQLQNKTYQEMFDRQIKNMDVQNDIHRQEAGWQLALSPITGLASGAAAGAQVGGKGGAIAGGAIGAIGGAITSAIDYKNTIKMMEENRQYSIDMYGYNLQNIQAVPTSLTKTSALTYNTRVWPFIEYYTCTDAEKDALKDKIKYNGMTIMKVGKLNDYLLGKDNFYKGQLIRLNIKVDSHMAYEIYNELNKGVYL